MPKDLRHMLEFADKGRAGNMASAPLAHRRSPLSPGEPRVFRVKSGFICGLCARGHSVLERAFDCLSRCTIELRLRTPSGRSLSGESGHFACTACGRGFANTDDAEDCFKRCMSKLNPGPEFKKALDRVQVRYVQRLQNHGARPLHRIDPLAEHTKMLAVLTQEQRALGRPVPTDPHHARPANGFENASMALPEAEGGIPSANPAVGNASAELNDASLMEGLSATQDALREFVEPADGISEISADDIVAAVQNELNSIPESTLTDDISADVASVLASGVSSDDTAQNQEDALLAEQLLGTDEASSSIELPSVDVTSMLDHSDFNQAAHPDSVAPEDASAQSASPAKNNPPAAAATMDLLADEDVFTELASGLQSTDTQSGQDAVVVASEHVTVAEQPVLDDDGSDVLALLRD